jgi:starch synthase
VSEGASLNILLAASEVVPFAKTGGLADVAGTLPRALARHGHTCAVILPLYHCARSANPTPTPTDCIFTVQVGSKTVPGRLWRSSLGGGSVPVYLIEQNDYFDRDDPAHGRGIYGYTSGDGSRRDYEDNCERFVFFNRAVLEALPLLDTWPDVIHVNDWQTGLLPVYLKEEYRKRGDYLSGGAFPGERLVDYDRIRTLLTIHNIAYQGVFWHWDMRLTGLDWRLFNPRQLEFYGKINFLKAGLVFADLLNTVSPTYAREIQTPYFGWGLQGVLYENRYRLSGIVNGVDYDVWDPRHDRHIAANYGSDDLGGKVLCKQALQKEYGLNADARAPLCGVVARLAEQKGIDLIAGVAPGILDQGAQLVILGEGERKYHQLFERLRDRYHGRLGLTLGFNEGLAHRIEAGADLFLMPSAFEPSGLNQLYSLRYGTPPVVRATGGLADTVTDTSPETLANGTATGFRFTAYHPHELWKTLERAIGLYRDYPDEWNKVMHNGMVQDWSWDRSAAEYEKLYRTLSGPARG